jgi:O-antigen/teichoic acid export membrane protein
MGFGTSFSKYIAEYNAKRDVDNMSGVVTVGLLYYLGVGLIVITVAMIFRDLILGRFNFGDVQSDVVTFVYIFFIFMLVMRLIGSVFKGVLTGLLRYDVLNKIKIATSSIYFGGIIFVLLSGYRLRGLAVNSAIYAFADLITMVAISFILVPGLRIRLRRGMKDLFFRMLKFGTTLQLVSIAELINAQIDKIFLGALRSVSLVGFYEIGAKIVNIAVYIPTIILPMLNPAASDLYARGEKEKIKEFYKKGTKMISVVILPIAAVVVCHADAIVSLWIGKTGLWQAATTARILVIGISAYMIVGVGRLMARGIGVPKYEMHTSLLIGFLNIILSYIMILKWGLSGAVIASSISLLAGSAFFLARFNRAINISIRSILTILFVSSILSAVSVLPTLFIPVILRSDFFADMSLRVISFIHITAALSITSVLYLSFIYITGFAREEISELLEMLKIRKRGILS